MVSDVKAMREITESPIGLFAADSPKLTLISMSTVTESLEKLMVKSYNTGKANEDLTAIAETLKNYYKNQK